MSNRPVSALSSTPISVHIQKTLLKPLPERCRELSQILRETSHKDLSSLFPQLVEHVYGFGHQSGWGLLALSRNQRPQDTETVFSFLAPDGPLLMAAYRLLGDGHTHYDFPVSCLPTSSQHLLEQGDIPLLYRNKVSYSGPGRVVTHVHLNPFEYYMFHFAYYILNPSQSKSMTSNSDLSDCLFIHLLESYLGHFLPLDGSPLPSPPFMTHQPPFRPTGYTSSLSCNLPGSLPSFSGSPQQMSCMFGPTSPSSGGVVGGLLKRPLSSVPSPPSGPMAISPAFQEEQRSQLLILTLVEFWLSISPNEDSNSFNVLFQGTFVPSALHIQLVRLMIKHLHLFSNSAVPNDNSLEISAAGQQSHWNAFKIQVIPRLVQKKLYTFLRLTFERWSLDASFRLPLETWLSYIQPWRYMDLRKQERDFYPEPPKDPAKAVGYQWQNFVTENLLFYTVLFKQLLPRFFRMELNSPKNSFLLFRVTKVFSQVNLQPMISEVEKSLQETCSSHLPSSANQSLSSNTLNQLRQFVMETEGYNYNYVPMFGEQSRETVSQVIHLAQTARQMASRHASDLERSKPGFFHSTINWLSSQEECQGGLTLAESQRVLLHLNIATTKLCQLFQLVLPHVEEPPEKSSLSRLERSFSEREEFKEKLRPMSFREIHYRGNPDLQPIRTFEVAFLVRMLNHLSTTINDKYQNEISSVYMREDWLGRMSRQMLSAPMVFHKEGDQEEALPPRVCLRTLAHKQLLTYMVLFYALLRFTGGFSFFSYVILLATIFIIYANMKAFVEMRRTR